MDYMKIFACTRSVSYLLNRFEMQNTSGKSNSRPKVLTCNRSPTMITFDNYMYINVTYMFGSSIRRTFFFAIMASMAMKISATWL